MLTYALRRTEKQNLDSQAHRPVAAITAEHLEAAAAVVMVALAEAMEGLLWVVEEVEVANSTSLTFVAPSLVPVFCLATRALTSFSVASLQCRLARHEGPVPTSRYDKPS